MSGPADDPAPASALAATGFGGRAIDVALTAISLAMLLPLVLLVGNAFKTPAEMIVWPPTIIPRDPTLENFRSVLADTPLPRWLFNSFVFAVLSTLAITATSALAGYIFAKFRYRSIGVIFVAFLATAIVPFEVYMIPLYFQVQALGLMNTIWGVLVAYLVMSFGIFLVRQNVLVNVPDELIEAARVDGAGELWIFLRVAAPLMAGPLAAVAVLAFFQAWTAFTWPFIIATTKESYTIEVGLALFQSGFTIDLGRLSAASALVLVPSITVFVFFRRSFVLGVSRGGVKE